MKRTEYRRRNAGRVVDKVSFAAVSRNYFNMPVWIMREAGFAAREGLEINLELHESIDEVYRRNRDGRARLAFGVTEQIILDSEAGGRLVILGGNVNKLPFTLVGGRSVSSIVDLKGRTIGVSAIEAGSSSLILQILAQSGLEYPRDYQLRAVGPILARWELLQSGEIDAGLQGAPLNYIAIDQGYPALFEPRKMFPDFAFTSLNADAEWVEANRDLVLRFMRAFIEAHRWFFANRDAASRIAMESTGVAMGYALRAWDEYASEEIFPRDGKASVAGVDTLIEISALIRALPNRAKTNARQYIDDRLWREALESLA